MATLKINFGLVREAVQKAASLAIQDTADFILMQIRATVPVDTGWLRDSYKKETVTPLHLIVGTMVNYAVWVEFGSSRNRAQPHFMPSWVQGESYFQQALQRYLKEI